MSLYHKLCVVVVVVVVVLFGFVFCLFFWGVSLFIFRGHSTREPASSRVTYFIQRAYTGTGVSHSQRRKKSGEVLKKMQVNELER